MNDFQVHARAMQQLQARLDGACPVITWGNVDYAIIPGSAIRRKDLSPGGFQLNADLRFDALVSTFSSASVADATSLKSKLLRTPIQYLGDDYQVSSVAILPGGLQITVECVSLVQKA